MACDKKAVSSDYMMNKLKNDFIELCSITVEGVKKMNEEKLFKLILKCKIKHNSPDLHSFMIDISNGTAYVEGRESGVYIEENYPDKKVQWEGTAIAAVNRLIQKGAKYETINM